MVLGMFETGLAVVRGLGRAGIRVLGLDHRFGTGFRSKYVKASVCPEPLSNPDGFIDYLARLAESEEHKPVLFVTSDDFLLAVSRNRERLQESRTSATFPMPTPSSRLRTSIGSTSSLAARAFRFQRPSCSRSQQT